MNKQLNAWRHSVFLLFVSFRLFSQFTAGNLVVLQAGDGASPLINTGNPIFLKEYSPLGVAGFSVAVSSSVNPLIISGSASSEGALSLSANGEYLVFGGYAQGLPNTTTLAASSASGINRGVGIVDVVGNYSRIAVSASFFSGNSIRGATSDGNGNYWAVGANNGTNYFGTVSPAATIQNSITNSRCISVFNGNLYFSCGSGTQGIFRAGLGLPVTSGQTASLIISTAGTGAGTPGPYGFYFNGAQTVCYVADERTPANGGGIQKWVYSAGTWTLAYTLGTGANYGARGVVADFSGNIPKVYATTSEGSINRLVAINDVGVAATATTLASSVPNGIFRGLAFAPYCQNPQITAVTAGGPACAGHSLVLNPVIIGPGPFTYTWSGAGGFIASVQSPTLVGPVSGNYSLAIANGCGTSTFSTAVVVNALPQIITNQPTICNGGNALLTASGANTYTWSNGVSSASITTNPGSTTVYTVSGTSLQGCTNSATCAVQVVDTLVLSAGSVSICEGSAALLTVSGAGSYSWSSGQNTSAISVTPSATVIYSVVGSASGCSATASTTATVAVNDLPVIAVNSVTVCAGSQATLVANGGDSYIWNSVSSGSVYIITPIATSVFTVIGLSAEGCSNSAVTTVTVLALPSVSLMPFGSSLCLNSPTIMLSGSPVGGVYSGTGVTGNMFDPATVGDFTLTYAYTDNNGCVNSDSKPISVDPCTGFVGEAVKDNEVTIYPNPASSRLSVKVDWTGTLKMLDNTGSSIYQQPLESGLNKMDITFLAPGIYFIKIANNSSSIGWFKFIKN